MAARLLSALGVAVLVLASATVFDRAEAGQNGWTVTGPSVAGMLWRLAVDPTRTATVYAAGSTGSGTAVAPRVFKTVDAGANWSEITNGIVNLAVNALAVDPSTGTTVYVGGYNPQAKALALYRSTDGGATWTLLGWPFSGGDLDRQVMAVAIDPTNNRTVYVATTAGLLKSVNGGDSWSVLSGLPNATFRAIVADRGSAGAVYAAGDAGLHKSSSGGTSWSASQSGLPLAGAAPRVTLLVQDPVDARVLYAVAGTNGTNDQVYRSADAGATWALAASGLPNNDVIRDLAVDPRNPRTLYAALNGGSGQNLMRSTDAGATWAPFNLPGGGYGSSVAVDALSPQTLHVGHNDAVWGFTFGQTGTPRPAATTTPAPTPTGAVPRDSRYFAETGYRIDNDPFWDYFNRRGGVRIFGFPTSRTFPFLGFTSQFFQRAVFQLGPDGSVRLLNLLDPGLLSYTSFNNAVMPSIDPSLVAAAPQPGSPGYATAVIAFVRANAPNVFEGQPVNYERLFSGTVTLAVAYPQGGGDPALLPGLNLEIWGVPTSRPARDPNNRDFIYQRFQRGIMHYDAACVCTNGILLADYLKAILTGRNLPPDLAQQAAGSPFLRQYNPSTSRWLDRPDQMAGTDLTMAFEQQ
ncbi:MAG TPA: hypothetical protein VG370_03070 [Chloroflexota bacterium]|nr:hypothetical protein [Chloroflexota bacterium]